MASGHGQSHEQEAGESELTKNAFKILYATDEDHEAPGADGAQEPLPGAGGQVRVSGERRGVIDCEANYAVGKYPLDL